MWTKKWPEEEGYYWFYGYRYGKESCGHKRKPEYMVMRCRKISDGFILLGNGQFVYESEPEEAHFLKIELPEPPF